MDTKRVTWNTVLTLLAVNVNRKDVMFMPLVTHGLFHLHLSPWVMYKQKYTSADTVWGKASNRKVTAPQRVSEQSFTGSGGENFFANENMDHFSSNKMIWNNPKRISFLRVKWSKIWDIFPASKVGSYQEQQLSLVITVSCPANLYDYLKVIFKLVTSGKFKLTAGTVSYDETSCQIK